MARQTDHTPVTIGDLEQRLEQLRQKVVELARRLSGGDSAAFKTLKVQKHALNQLEQQFRFRQKRERRLAWGV